MGKVSNIDWLANPYTGEPGSSWNPWTGCRKITRLCQNCYMYREQLRWGRDPSQVHRSAKGTFDSLMKFPQKSIVFVGSWSDFFIEEAVEGGWCQDAWKMMARRPDLFYLIPTKRPYNMDAKSMPAGWGEGWKNVMFLFSAGTQEDVDGPIMDACLEVPGQWGLSMEPLLEPVSLRDRCFRLSSGLVSPFDWNIIGGESGPGYRPFQWGWARDLVMQSVVCRTPVFIKQEGGWPDKKHDVSGFPEDLRIREYPKAILDWLK